MLNARAMNLTLFNLKVEELAEGICKIGVREGLFVGDLLVSAVFKELSPQSIDTRPLLRQLYRHSASYMQSENQGKPCPRINDSFEANTPTT